MEAKVKQDTPMQKLKLELELKKLEEKKRKIAMFGNIFSSTNPQERLNAKNKKEALIKDIDENIKKTKEEIEALESGGRTMTMNNMEMIGDIDMAMDTTTTTKKATKTSEEVEKEKE